MRIVKTKWYINRIKGVQHDINGTNILFSVLPSIRIEYFQGWHTSIFVSWLVFGFSINNIPREDNGDNVPWE